MSEDTVSVMQRKKKSQNVRLINMGWILNSYNSVYYRSGTDKIITYINTLKYSYIFEILAQESIVSFFQVFPNERQGIFYRQVQ